jgi:hypothetical protein
LRYILGLGRIAQLEKGVAKDSLAMTADDHLPCGAFSASGLLDEIGFGQWGPVLSSV